MSYCPLSVFCYAALWHRFPFCVRVWHNSVLGHPATSVTGTPGPTGTASSLPPLSLLAPKLHLSSERAPDCTCFLATYRHLGMCLPDSVLEQIFINAEPGCQWKPPVPFGTRTLQLHSHRGGSPPRFHLTALLLDLVGSFQLRLNAVKRSLTTWRGSRVAEDGRTSGSKMQGGKSSSGCSPCVLPAESRAVQSP